MKKITIKNSESRPSHYRVVINISDDISLGCILSKYELKKLNVEIDEIINTIENEE